MPADWPACVSDEYGAACTSADELFQDEYGNVAPGHRDPHAAPYAGTTHPLIFMNTGGNYSWDQRVQDELALGQRVPPELTPAYVTDVQLVALVPDAVTTTTTSCGTYSAGGGQTGTLSKTVISVTVTVVAARTGRVVATRTFTGTGQEDCPATFESTGGPPWTLDPGPAPAYGHDASADAGSTYTSNGTGQPQQYSSAVTAWINGLLTGPPV